MNTTPQFTQVQGHPASVDAYIRQGWQLVPIPQGTKGPTNRGWNRKENALQSAASLPAGHGIGLAHAYSGTMALDVDDWERAGIELAQHGIDLQQLYDAPDAVTIESGKQGHGKLLYAMPFGVTLPSKKIAFKKEGVNQVSYELRCATANGLTVQDVLPPSIHPETCQPYRWGGRGHWSRLPTLPVDLLRVWQDMADVDQKRTINDGEGVDASWDDIRLALEQTPADLNREDWVSIGMALHWAGTQTNQMDQAFHLWDEWSSQSPEKYKGTHDLSVCWRSFEATGGATLGTLFHIAKGYGWKRPTPTAQELFATVETFTPDTASTGPLDVMAGLRPPPPDMDMTLWPTILSTRAVEISDSVGCDPLVPLFAGLAVAAGVTDARTRLELMPGYRVPPVLWLMTLGDPADKKSPGSMPMSTVLRQIEKEDHPRYQKALLTWEGQEAAYESAHKAFLDHYSNAEAQLANDATPTVPDLPPRPVPLKITVQDITSQKLIRHAADRPAGLLCWLDEMNAWVRKVCDNRSGEDRSAWVMSYESNSYEMDRVGAGSIWCENLAVSIYGNIQPKVFKENIDGMAHDGLIQRFIPAILRPGQTRLGHPVPEAFSSKSVWDQLVRTIHSLPERTYTLSPDAYKKFRTFQQWYETTKQEERVLQAHDTYMTAFGKLEGQCGRLALVTHIMTDPYAQEVSGVTMANAINIVRSYIIPALRYAFGEVGGLVDDSLDAWLASHILANAGIQESLSLRDIKHSARRRLDDLTPHQKDEIIIEGMSTLERCQWVQLVESDPRRNQYNWVINPNLVTAFREQRDMVLRIKQKRLDENVRRSGGRASRRLVPGYDPATMD